MLEKMTRIKYGLSCIVTNCIGQESLHKLEKLRELVK